MLCFAATVFGTIFHYVLGWQAPYAFFSLPKLTGTIGGISLALGTAGQFWLKRKADPDIRNISQMGMDYAFIVQLFLAAVTGLALMAFRETAALAPLLVIHLAVILSLFITMPFGKFVHGLYRSGALIKYAKEQPAATDVGGLNYNKGLIFRQVENNQTEGCSANGRTAKMKDLPFKSQIQFYASYHCRPI